MRSSYSVLYWYKLEVVPNKSSLGSFRHQRTLHISIIFSTEMPSSRCAYVTDDHTADHEKVHDYNTMLRDHHLFVTFMTMMMMKCMMIMIVLMIVIMHTMFSNIIMVIDQPQRCQHASPYHDDDAILSARTSMTMTRPWRLIELRATNMTMSMSNMCRNDNSCKGEKCFTATIMWNATWMSSQFTTDLALS